MLTDPTRDFLARHARLMNDPEAVLPCCFYDGMLGTYCCDAEATHAVVATIPDPWVVTAREDLPPAGQHPEFCHAHAEVVRAQRQAVAVEVAP